MMLMPIRTFVVFAASHGISGMPWSHSPPEDTGNAFGERLHHAERVLELLAIGGFRDDDPVERPDGVEVELLGETSQVFELSTVTLSRKFGKYRASFMKTASSP